MPTLRSNGISIAYQTAGDPRATPLLLIMDAGMQLTAWPQNFVDGLAELDFYVIRFDNRDCGLSTKFKRTGTPNLTLAALKARLGVQLHSPYRIDDMADDALGVLGALGLAQAHVVGMALGAAIGESLAARHPARVLSLTSIMADSGRRRLPGASRRVRWGMLRRTPGDGQPERLAAHMAALQHLIGSPAYPTAPRHLLDQAQAAIRRGVCAPGAARQRLAYLVAGDRSAQLRAIVAPTLVIHGAHDPLVPLARGVDAARLIPGAQLEVIEGMGHDLPSQLIERLTALIDVHAHGKMASDSIVRLFEKQ
jgi:pimeloyl-ACP methyl ester carboxylesterase